MANKVNIHYSQEIPVGENNYTQDVYFEYCTQDIDKAINFAQALMSQSKYGGAKCTVTYELGEE